MRMTELFLAELDREASATRRTLERVPEGHNDTMINQDELDLRPKDGSSSRPQEAQTNGELLQAFDESVIKARKALESTTDEHLMGPWRLLAAGQVMAEQPRHIMLRDSVFNHLAHHRGQLTVYLRLNHASVPAIYGPSADEGRAA